MPGSKNHDLRILAGGLLVLACSLGSLASALALLAYDHMAGSANLCTGAGDHCLACAGAVACLAAALTTGGAGVLLLQRPLAHLAA